jgi:3-oxoacyl-[acyl-carrier-protein] synthase II
MVTGLGIVSALGESNGEVWERLLSGACALVPNGLGTGGLVRKLAAMDCEARALELALAALELALSDARLQRAERTCLGVSVGASLERLNAPSPAELYEPLGADLLLTSACSSGADAVALGASWIAAGRALSVACLSVDVLGPAKASGHRVLATVSPTVARPYDRNRDGTTLGEGAVCVILEAREAMQARRGAARARLAGVGRSCDAADLLAPDSTGAGAALAIERALRSADIDFTEVGYVHGHGTGTRLGDLAEARAMARVARGGRRPPVSSSKGALGHTLAAAGAVGAWVAVMAVAEGVAPPNVGLRCSDEALEIDSVRPGSVAVIATRSVLSLSAAMGGFNSALLFVAPDRSSSHERGPCIGYGIECAAPPVRFVPGLGPWRSSSPALLRRVDAGLMAAIEASDLVAELAGGRLPERAAVVHVGTDPGASACDEFRRDVLGGRPGSPSMFAQSLPSAGASLLAIRHRLRGGGLALFAPPGRARPLAMVTACDLASLLEGVEVLVCIESADACEAMLLAPRASASGSDAGGSMPAPRAKEGKLASEER